MFYGNIGEDVLFEQQMLLEMHLSNSDLKDPKILEKVLEKSKKEAQNTKKSISIASFLVGVSSSIISAIVTGSVVVGLATFLPFIIGSCALVLVIISHLPDYEKKNVDKLEKKVKQLKEKTNKLKDSSEKKRILATCDKILKSIEEYKNKKINDANKAKYKEDKEFVNYIINALKGKSKPHAYLDKLYEVYYIADKIGVATSKELDNGFTKYCSSHLDKSGILTHITNYNNYEDAMNKANFSEKELKQFESLIPGFKENAPFVDLGSHDEGLFFYNQKNSSYYYGAYGFFDKWDVNKSLYSIVSKYSKEYKVKFSEEEIENYKSIYESIKS